MAQQAVQSGRISIKQACLVFGVSVAGYRYQPRLSSENAEIADHLIRLTHNQRNWDCKLMLWAEKHAIRLEHIQPGNPQQNAYVERYNRTVRYDWLGHYLFESITEVQEHATRWVWTYNHERPNMALGGITPNRSWPSWPDLYF